MKSKYYDYTLLVLFIVMFFVLCSFLVTGRAWNTISDERTFFWIAFLMAFLAMSAGVVFIYSLVHYAQLPNLRSLIIMFLGANVVVFSFLFLMTHPSTLGSPLAGRDRNRTVVTALGFLLTPGVLAGSVFGGKELTTRNRNFVILWGLILQPLFSISLLLTEDPLFKVTDPAGGLAGLTPIGWLLTIVVGSTAVVSLARYTKEWFDTRDRIVLGSTLALVFWLYTFVVYSLLENPYEVAELLWIGGVIAGFTMLSVAMIFTAIIEPHRGLESLVEKRTKELEMARKESDLYLSMWVHKMGNLLQGIVSYLEILARGESLDNTYRQTIETAMKLSRESTFFNRQVATLSEIKSSGEKELVPYNLETAIEKAHETVEEMLKGTNFRFEISEIHDTLLVRADNKLDILFTNIFVNEILSREGEVLVSVETAVVGNQVEVRIGTDGARPTDSEIDQLLTTDIPDATTLNLNLFSARLLLERYHSSIEYYRNEDQDRNEYVIKLYKYDE
jgi:hypothetical protein